MKRLFSLLVIFLALGFSVGQVLATDVTLQWTEPTNSPVPVVGYHLYQNGKLVGTTILAGTTETTISGLTDGTYTWFFRSYGQYGVESINSNEVSLTLPINAPSPPTGVGIKIIVNISMSGTAK